ncbi:MAG: DNA polymerase III subunit gamma/tau [Blastocatellia bacterium]
MSYQVIARKYRPQTFMDLTGQEHITRTLGNALDQRRLHHAYLFSGVRGTGKTTTARILAKGLNCHQGVTSRPCLECASCREIVAGNSMDVQEIDAASNTGVDNVRDVIINTIAMAPARDRYKVFVIDEVHMLSSSAFNALLKTLEEPPAHVVFIMATTELHKVPDTILSRCQQFEFRQIATEKIYHRLREIADAEQVKISDAALREVARAGAGSLRDAQSALDQVIAFSGTEISEEDVTISLGLVSAATLGKFTEAIAGRDTPAIMRLVEEVSSRGHDLRNFTRELMAYLRHLLLVQSGITAGEILGVADVELARLRELAPRFSEEDLVRCFHLLADTEKEIKDSPHPRFQLEIGLVKLTHAIRLRTLDALIRRVEELASGSPPGGSPGIDSGRAAVTPASAPKATRPEPAAPPFKAKPAAPPPDEPPDYPEFDLSEPVDLRDRETSLLSRPSPAPAKAPSRAVLPGREVEAIHAELEQMKKGLIAAALDDAQELAYEDDALIVTVGADDVLAKRLRGSADLFRQIGDRLLGRPIRIEVRISGEVDPRVSETELKRQDLHERAKDDPAVQTLLEKSRGEIVWVRESPAPGEQ